MKKYQTHALLFSYSSIQDGHKIYQSILLGWLRNGSFLRILGGIRGIGTTMNMKRPRFLSASMIVKHGVVGYNDAKKTSHNFSSPTCINDSNFKLVKIPIGPQHRKKNEWTTKCFLSTLLLFVFECLDDSKTRSCGVQRCEQNMHLSPNLHQSFIKSTVWTTKAQSVSLKATLSYTHSRITHCCSF